MKTLYLECNMGAAGDMLMAALLELHPSPGDFIGELNALGIPGVAVSAAPAVRCGITGTSVSVTVGGREERSEDVHLHGHLHNHVDGHEHSHDPGDGHAHAHEDHNGHNHEHPHNHGDALHHRHTGMVEIKALLDSLPLSQKVKADASAVY